MSISYRKYSTAIYACLVLTSIISSIFLIAGCSKTNKNVLDENKFMNVYIDLIIAHDTTSKDQFEQIKQLVFKKNKITQHQYKTTLTYYNRDPKRWQVFFDKVIKRLEKLKKEAK